MAVSRDVAQQEHPAADTFALGTTLTTEEAVPQDAVVESVSRGGEVFLSVNMASASREQVVEVAWFDPWGRELRRNARRAQPGKQYLAFSSGSTTRWTAGVHRALVVIDGRAVNEKAFPVM